jgi:hypothetical protein
MCEVIHYLLYEDRESENDKECRDHVPFQTFSDNEKDKESRDQIL